MDVTLAGILTLVRDSVQRPREGARGIMALNLPMPARWMAFVLMAVAGAMAAHASVALLPAADREMMAGMVASPFRTAMLQGVVMLLIVMATFRFGRMRGGRGTFADALLLIAWLQFILLCLQGVQLVAQVVLPPLAELVGIAAVGLFLWLLTNFIAELHGFRSLASVFGGIMLVLFGLAFLMALLIGILLGGAPGPGT